MLQLLEELVSLLSHLPTEPASPKSPPALVLRQPLPEAKQCPCLFGVPGRAAEWLKATDCKSAEYEYSTWVRILPLPPNLQGQVSFISFINTSTYSSMHVETVREWNQPSAWHAHAWEKITNFNYRLSVPLKLSQVVREKKKKRKVEVVLLFQAL